MVRSPAPSRSDAWSRAVEDAVDQGRLAPSVHNTQPWRFVVGPHRLELHADPSRQLAVLDPDGRELLLSCGAALLNVRASLAASGFAVTVDRLAAAGGDPELVAVVRPVAGGPDPALARLDRSVRRRHTNRRPFGPEHLTHELTDALADAVAAEHTLLVPVLTESARALVAELTQEADRLQNADPAYREELAGWIGRPPAEGDGITPGAVPRTAGPRPDAVPVRDFDVHGTGGLPRRTGSGTEQSLLLLATPTDHRLDWLRAGEALQRLLLELTRRDWVAGPLTQALEVPAVRDRLRRLTAPAVPQMLLRVGRAAPAEPAAHRPRCTVVEGSTRGAPTAPPPVPPAEPGPAPEPGPRPASDGRGGTTWR
ncbi:Acg family FMN-binding oxidoreductase [Geodermatophilus sp. SYSU D00691]